MKLIKLYYLHIIKLTRTPPSLVATNSRLVLVAVSFLCQQ